ncbi:hypothetical protein [Sphingomonas psychrotolerans]|uniref:Alpha/beta hydrolase n=1 Tax=Sphingomonas psychrotolerans TaxID=1327635 RepID=A0A2K8MMF9_9SPHN|nr:hypothetical protein [Sphingomonas psychrotolerans]ATY34244.1 hypothetical protein CVN68_21660 [Sphingomonas psychrotolerans]
MIGTAETSIFQTGPLGCEALVIAFSSLGVDSVAKPFEFHNLLDRSDCAVLLLRDPDTSWYHGVPDLPGGPSALADALAEHARGFRRVICIGYSMGGYAALLFGRLIGAETIIALAPQTILSHGALDAWGDHRWDAQVERVQRQGDARLLDLAPLYHDTRHLLPDQAITICLSASGECLDVQHAFHLKRHAALHMLGSEPLAHGALVVALRESGLMRMMIDEAIAGVRTDLSLSDRFAGWMAKSRHSLALDPAGTRIDGSMLGISGTLAMHSASQIARDAAASHPVRLGARLWPEGRFGGSQREARFDFPPGDLTPGSVHRFAITIDLGNLPPGRHEVVVALVREGRFWFDEFGFNSARIGLVVDRTGISCLAEGAVI